MLKFGFEYSFYIFDEYSGIYAKSTMVYMCAISVVQTLWFLNQLLIQCQSVLQLVPAETSTIYGGSNSSTCRLKALI